MSPVHSLDSTVSDTTYHSDGRKAGPGARLYGRPRPAASRCFPVGLCQRRLRPRFVGGLQEQSQGLETVRRLRPLQVEIRDEIFVRELFMNFESRREALLKSL